MAVILITGGNRGIGLGLVEHYLSQPNNTVITSVRDISHPSSKGLLALPKGTSSSLILVKIDSVSENDAKLAIEELRSKHHISVLDLVIANAGISTIWPKVVDVKPVDMLKHYKVNVIGPVLLFQAVLPLLEKSEKGKFVAISSSAGLITEMVPFPNAAYGVSKAALNYELKAIHNENESLIVIPIDPGFVQTDMGNTAAAYFGMDKAYITVEESIAGITNIIASATREETSGKFWEYTGKQCQW